MFRAQIIDNQQIAGQVFLGQIGIFFPIAELCGFKISEELAGGIIDHAVAVFRHSSCDAGGEEGLAQARAAGKKQTAAAFSKIAASTL